MTIERMVELASECGVSLTGHQAEQIESFRRLLWEWNQRLNLTRHTTLEQFVVRDLLDAYQLSHLLCPGETVLDVGSGGGVPGILVAILRPDAKMTLSEAVSKKARVLQEMVDRLGLEVPVLAERAERAVERQAFDVVMARAVGGLSELLGWFRGRWHHVGRMLLVKGPTWVEQRKEARHRGLLKPLELRRVASYSMPGTGAESVILALWPKPGSVATRSESPPSSPPPGRRP